MKGFGKDHAALPLQIKQQKLIYKVALVCCMFLDCQLCIRAKAWPGWPRMSLGILTTLTKSFICFRF